MDVDAVMAVAAEAADMAAALQVPVSAALEVSASPVLQVSADLAALAFMYTALEVSTYTADAHFLDAASAAVAVAAAVGAAELAGYGLPRGAGSTPAGPNLHRLVKKLASRRSADPGNERGSLFDFRFWHLADIVRQPVIAEVI